MDVLDDAEGPLDPRIQIELENLNNATDEINKLEIELDVMDAENQKAECGREHHRRAMLVHDAETKVQQLEEKYRRSIIKARPYFEVLAQCDQMLATQKERVEFLQKGVKEAKHNYSASLRALEEISNQIHQQRRDFDMVANGPREPGVGAELISPPESLNYQAELNKLNISRINSLASSSNETDIDDRARDFEDVFVLRQKMDQLSSRSVDGSESTASQWELELQASMEKLNNLPIRKSNFENIDADCRENGDPSIVQKQESDSVEKHVDPEEKSEKNEESEDAKLPSDFDIFKKPLARTDSSSQPQHLGWQSLTQSPINSILNKSKLALKNSLSKSLSNSPINMGNFNFARRKVEGMPTRSVQKDVVAEETTAKNLAAQEKSQNTFENVETRTSESKNVENVNKIDINEPPRTRKIISVDKSSTDIEEFIENCTTIIDDQSDPVLRADEEADIKSSMHPAKPTPSSLRVADQEDTSTKVQVQKYREQENLGWRSVDSSPNKTCNPTSSRPAKFANNNVSEGFFECPGLRKSKSRTSSVKELPLLAIFEPSAANNMPKDRSCSMVNLAEKQNLKTLLDSTSLGNIQTVSVDKLATARQNLVNRDNSD
ncbi:uncharacterized protein LOC107272480 isoform X2 [Cephus cinctus]|uniref:Uncharacterized protein LOC107272480 isoform X2 n=1 Tax=Cephus cinctus TaxID=211228 RepID=A0AAJ7RRW2_CEPCN|nr:uncharacterized protein LOC107272480 isoform X2 [Cephus cinctus]